jgi:hypothetical protein
MANHLLGWRLIGLVLSVLCFVGFFSLALLAQGQFASDFAAGVYSKCRRTTDATSDGCWAMASKFLFEPSWENISATALVAAAPILMAWLVSWLIYHMVRQIKERSGTLEKGPERDS